MGFDYVKHETECPNCKNKVDGFQTKDLGGWFETVDYWKCDNFYSSCDYCNVIIEFNRKRNFIPIEEYEVTLESTGWPEESLIRNSEGRIMGYEPFKREIK